MISTLQTVHDLLRWAVLAIAVAGVVLSLATLRSRATAPGWGRTLSIAFVSLLDLQLMIGIVLFLANPGIRGAILGHVTLMTTALLAAHGLRMRMKRAESPLAARLALGLYVVPLALVVLGISAIPPEL